jgi:TonB-linked SusC/RagA family outer membrane protein
MKLKFLKLLAAMTKLSFYGIILQLAFAGALIASDLNAQKIQSIREVYINLDLDNASLLETFRAIERQTNYKFGYENAIIDNDIKVDFNRKKISVADALLEISKISGLKFRQINNYINIDVREEDQKPSVEVVIQGINVSGTVTSEEDGSGLPGVNVIIKSTNQGTVTDLDGNYALEVPDQETVLVFSSVGYAKKEFTVGNRTIIDVNLSPDITALDEIVVTALGISREKMALGYSIEEVEGENLTKTPHENVLNGLSGKLAGVAISQMDGLVGSSVSMVIRGATSLNTDNQPLFVIDGVPVANSLNNFYQGADLGNPISDMNAADVESVTVLKGPSAAALYGSRAGNGVVLITTKSGSRAKKGFGLGFNTAVTFDIPYNYIDYQTEFGPGKAGAHVFEEAENENWGPRLDAGEEWIQWNTNGLKAPLVSYDNRLTDFYQTGITFTNNISFSGNNELGEFRLSVGDMRNTGIVPNTDLRRQSVNLNGSYKLRPNFKVQASVGLVGSGSDNRPVVDGGRNTVVRSVYEMSAHVDINDLEDYWIPGLENLQQLKYKHKQNNPWFLAHENTIGFQRDRTVARLQFDWDIIDGLTLTGRYSRDGYTEDRESKKAFSTYGQWEGGYETEFLDRRESNYDLLLSYNKNFREMWDLSAMIGGNHRYDFGKTLSNGASSLVVPDLYTISNAVPGTVSYNSSWYEKTINGIYGMASLGYNNMIYLDVTGRNDWSSTLPAENNSYFYPSVSLSAIMSEMFTTPEWLSFAKLRGGVAQVGNDVGPYQLAQYFSTAEDWGTAKQMYMGGVLKNTSLKPEIATSKEVGLDMRFLNNRIGFEVTYYTLENKNQVLNIGLPIESGASSKQINAGLIASRGWEIGVMTTPVVIKDFRFDLNFNISRNRTTIKELAEGIEYFQFGQEGTAFVRTYVGETIGDIYAKPLLTVQDASSPYFGYPIVSNGGIVQRDNDPAHMEKIGNFNPDFIMGIQPTLSYKAFSLYANIDWRQGGEFYSRTMVFLSNNGQLESTFSGVPYDPNRSIEDQIRENPGKYFQNWVGGRTGEYGGFPWEDASLGREDDASFHPGVREVIDGSGNKTYVENLGGPGTIWLTPFTANKQIVRQRANANLYSATYVKIRELALAYHLPQSFSRKIGLQKASLSVVAKNIFEWTRAGVDFDPERAFKGGSQWVQGIEYYNALPWIGSLGFRLDLEF